MKFDILRCYLQVLNLSFYLLLNQGCCFLQISNIMVFMNTMHNTFATNTFTIAIKAEIIEIFIRMLSTHSLLLILFCIYCWLIDLLRLLVRYLRFCLFVKQSFQLSSCRWLKFCCNTAKLAINSLFHCCIHIYFKISSGAIYTKMMMTK